MKRRTINGQQVNPVGLGCMSMSWGYGTPPGEDAAITLLNRALDIGCNHLDTANIYGLGHSEKLIAKALKGRRSEYFLASKMGIVVDGSDRGVDCSPAAIRRCIDESLMRLETDFIDLYYMHRFDPKVPIADMVGTVADLVSVGKIGSIGLSEWSAGHIREAAAVHRVAAVQTEYSLWTRNPEIAVLDVCAELDISFVAFSPVGRGALANGVRDTAALSKNDLRRLMPRFSDAHWPQNLALLDQFSAIAAREGRTPAQLALAWVLAKAPHIVTIPGTANIAHLEENMAAASWDMPRDLFDELDALINTKTVSGPRYSDGMQQTIDTEEFAA